VFIVRVSPFILTIVPLAPIPCREADAFGDGVDDGGTCADVVASGWADVGVDADVDEQAASIIVNIIAKARTSQYWNKYLRLVFINGNLLFGIYKI
jgi:hypothetical protein